MLIFIDISKNYFFLNFFKKVDYFLILTTILTAAGGYAINDYFDYKIDMVNRPNSISMSKYITRRKVLIIHLITSSLALLCSVIYIEIFEVNIAIFVSIILLWFYSSYFKKKLLIGNLIVSFLAFLSIFIIYYVKNHSFLQITTIAIFAFISTLIREIIKDIEDIKGDRLFGCTTIPIVFGLKTTKIFLWFLFLALVSQLVISIDVFNIFINIYWIVILGPFLAFMIYKLYWADKKADFTYLSFLSKILMVIGISGLLFN